MPPDRPVDASQALIPADIPPRDRQVVLLSGAYFWLKYRRRNRLQPAFQPSVPASDGSPLPEIEVISFFFSLKRQLDQDVSGQALDGIVPLLHQPRIRRRFWPNLSPVEIASICHRLEEMFENQEFCATCEGWSYYDDVTAEQFAIQTALDMLWLIEDPPLLPYLQTAETEEDGQRLFSRVLESSLRLANSGQIAYFPFTPHPPD